MQNASAICSRGQDPSAADTSSKDAKQMWFFIICLIALKALHMAVAADPNPLLGGTPPQAFCHHPSTLAACPYSAGRYPRNLGAQSKNCWLWSFSLRGGKSTTAPPGTFPYHASCRSARCCDQETFSFGDAHLGIIIAEGEAEQMDLSKNASIMSKEAKWSVR